MGDKTKAILIELINILIDSETAFTDEEMGDHAHTTFCGEDIDTFKELKQSIILSSVGRQEGK